MNTHTSYKTSARFSFKQLLFALCSTSLLYGCEATIGGGGSQDADPVAVDLAIAYIERPLARDEEENDALVTDNSLDPTTFRPGARLVIKDRATVQAAKVVITDAAFSINDGDTIPNFTFDDENRPMYDVKDLEVSSDGLKMVFSMRAPEDPDLDEDEQPTWNIWEYNREEEILRRLINSDINAEAGHDVSPAYLPDGRIVFSSTRQRRSKAILLDENKPQFGALAEQADDEAESFLLHVMDEDGLNIEQISFNQSHDIQPTVLESGEILFLRWNGYINDSVSLYKTNPDGSDTEILYGHHSQRSGSDPELDIVFNHARELSDGSLLVNLRPRNSTRLGGDLTVIDTEFFIDNNQGTFGNSGAVGPAQTSATFGNTSTDDTVSAHGVFSSAYPWGDSSDRFIVSWSACSVRGAALDVYVNETLELIDENSNYVDYDGDPVDAPIVATEDEVNAYPCSDETLENTDIAEADPLYGIWIYDIGNETLAPVVLPEPETMYTEVLALSPNQVIPAHIPTPVPGVDVSQELIDGKLGIVHIRSVYDYDGVDTSPGGISALANPGSYLAADRPARFIRLVKAVSTPSEDVRDVPNQANGYSGNQGMKEILGYVPVEPDGSAKFIVPADVAFSISILDGNGRRISNRHQNWLSVAAGETKNCNGCHSRDSFLPHGRSDAALPSINTGAATTENFPNTVLSVVDENEPDRDLWTPAPPPEMGETMAEYYARINGPRTPSLDITFDDDWTDPSVRSPDPSIADWAFTLLPSEAPPVPKTSCLTSWDGLCRTVINYIEHIQPIWEAPVREVPDPNDPGITLTVSCMSCHQQNNGILATAEPPGQLELTNTLSQDQNFYLNSYVELFRADTELIDDPELGLIERRVPITDDSGNPLFHSRDNDTDQLEYLDADGNPTFAAADADGNQHQMVTTIIDDGNDEPLTETVAVNAYLAAGSANNGRNSTFFARFAPGGAHAGRLEPSEIKLISEWLDLGAQYYNNPFDAPEN